MMKYIATILSVISLVLAIASFYQREKIAYVSSQRVFDEFHGTKELKKSLDGLAERHRSVLDSMMAELQAFEKAGDRRLGERKAMYMEAEELFMQEQQEMAEAYTARIWGQINQYSLNYGKQAGYAYILGANSNGSLVYASEQNDITDEVIEYINKEYAGLGH